MQNELLCASDFKAADYTLPLLSRLTSVVPEVL